MTSSKIFLLLGLLLAIALVISSEVAARDLAEASTDDNKVDVTAASEAKNTVEDSTNGGSVAHPDQGGGGGGGGCRRYCCRYYGYRCVRWCCRYPGQPLDHDGDGDAKLTDHDQAKPGN